MITGDETEDVFVVWLPGQVPAEAQEPVVDKIVFEASDLTAFLDFGLPANLVKLVFESPVACRGIGESYRSRLWQVAKRPLIGMHTVESSTWLRWLRQESLGLLDDRRHVHYAIITADDCIEVVTDSEPTFTLQSTEALKPPWVKRKP